VEAHAGNADPQRPGRILAAERERQGLGPADIAQRLRMSAWQVEALEADDYSRLPRGPFLRGFVRNYAKALGLQPDSVLAHLAEVAPREAAQPIVVPSQNIRFDPLADRMANPYVKAAAIASVVVALGFAGMYWWMFVRNAPVGVAKKGAPTVVATAPTATSVPPPVVAQVPKAEPAKVDPPKVDPPKVDPPKVETPKAEPPKKAELAKVDPPKVETPKTEPGVQRVASTTNGGTLKLRFKGKSWVEIKDGGGRVILTGLNDPGSEAEVSGKPPFRVIVGNAPDVQLFVNDREFNLAPHIREAVARFTVD
jgi:cytoskeleton protein RodZ